MPTRIVNKAPKTYDVDKMMNKLSAKSSEIKIGARFEQLLLLDSNIQELYEQI